MKIANPTSNNILKTTIPQILRLRSGPLRGSWGCDSNVCGAEDAGGDGCGGVSPVSSHNIPVTT